MKRLLLLLLFLSQPVQAQWEQYDDSQPFSSYLDPSTARIQPDGLQVWVLTAFKMDMNYPPGRFRSIKSLLQFDCIGGRSRMLRYALHAGPMGDGAVIEEAIETTPWVGYVENSSEERLHRVACSLRSK